MQENNRKKVQIMKIFKKCVALGIATVAMANMMGVAWADDNTYSVTSSTASTSLVDSNVSSTGTKVYASTTSSGEAKTGDECTPEAYGITYTVVIPQTIHLENATADGVGTGTYEKDIVITATGDIGEAQALTVVPEATTDSDTNTITPGTVQLTGSGYAKGAVATCTIGAETSDTMYRLRDELLKSGTTYTYPASAELTPGDWVGYMDVDIALCTGDEVVPYLSTTVTASGKIAPWR
jgi:hypothetical protein